MYLSHGHDVSYSNSVGPQLYSSAENPVDGNSTVAPKVTVQWGAWNKASQTFVAGTGAAGSSGSPLSLAVKVTVERDKARNNAVPLVWGAVLGKGGYDLNVSTVAAVVPQSASVTIPGTADLYLAGMPAGTTASYDDSTSTAPPYQATGIPVVPGTYITLTNMAGGVKHDPRLSNDGPDGYAGFILSHGADSPGGPTPAAENGIADVVMPIDAVMGVFLDNKAPNLTPAPGRRDYTSAASRDQAQYNDIQLKQPFFIGDGQTSGGATQKFLVPPGATRLFLSTMDGHEWKNNSGSFTGTVTASETVELVQ